MATDDFTHVGRVIERSTFGSYYYSVSPKISKDDRNKTIQNIDLV